MKIISEAGTWKLVCHQTSYEDFWGEVYPLLEKADVPFRYEYLWADASAVRVFFAVYEGDYTPPVEKLREFLTSGLSVFFD